MKDCVYLFKTERPAVEEMSSAALHFVLIKFAIKRNVDNVEKRSDKLNWCRFQLVAESCSSNMLVEND